ncbi:MAG TPA: FAD-binding oxidoreductase [Solirubrobacter sp.]|nr:FAD-binding oxidoreductase [Solirubrobacter sp.]
MSANPAPGQFWNIRPQAVIGCRTPEEVAEALAHARHSGLQLAVRSGGHCFAGRSTTDGIVIDTGPMDAVEVADGTVRVGAGARLGAIYDALSAHGLAIAAGCGPTVGIAGLALGGGLGILGRRHGLASDQVLSAQAVLADGRVVECDADTEPDLFWALRGAGGCQFAIVTAFTLRTVPAPNVTTVHLQWRVEDAEAVLAAWQEWAPDAPDEVAVSLLVTAGPDPAEPPVAHAFGVGVEPPFPPPASADLREFGLRAAKRHLAEHGPGEEAAPGAHVYAKSEFFRRSLDAQTIAELLAHLAEDRVAGEARTLDFSPWGGAYNGVPETATAFAHRAERFLLKPDVVVGAAGAGHARDWLRRCWAITHACGSGRAYPNFPDPELEDWRFAYHGANVERLAQVKRAYDPDNVFRFDQSL